jgi:hypothetical protein
MDRRPFARTRVRTAVIAGGIGLCLAGAAWLHSGPSRVLGVASGTRLLAVSRGTLYWLGRTCSIWRADLDGGHIGSEPLEPLLPVGSCPADDPRVDGDVIYQLTGLGQVVRHSAQQRAPMVQRRLLYALALDAKYLYAGNCAQANNCQIERMPAEDDPGDPILMQAGIHALANMDVDQNEIFWVDRGLRKPICGNETNPDTNVVEYHCQEGRGARDRTDGADRLRRAAAAARRASRLLAGRGRRAPCPESGRRERAGAADAHAIGLRRRR